MTGQLPRQPGGRAALQAGAACVGLRHPLTPQVQHSPAQGRLPLASPLWTPGPRAAGIRALERYLSFRRLRARERRQRTCPTSGAPCSIETGVVHTRLPGTRCRLLAKCTETVAEPVAWARLRVRVRLPEPGVRRCLTNARTTWNQPKTHLRFQFQSDILSLFYHYVTLKWTIQGHSGWSRHCPATTTISWTFSSPQTEALGPVPRPTAPGKRHSTSVPVDVPGLGASCKWDRTRLRSLSIMFSRFVTLQRGSDTPSCYGRVTFHYVDGPRAVYPRTARCYCCVPPSEGAPGSWPQQLHRFLSHPMHKGSRLSTSSPALVIFHFGDNSQARAFKGREKASAVGDSQSRESVPLCLHSEWGCRKHARVLRNGLASLPWS